MIRKKEPQTMNAFKIDKLVRPFKKRSKYIKSVRLVKIDIDSEKEDDIKSGKAVIITNEEAVDKKNNRTIDGIYSPSFGTDLLTEKSMDSSYHCECGELIGGEKEDEICPTCGTPVVWCNADLSITGYIPLGDYVIISPACYLDLESLIGGVELKDIIKFNNRFNVNGKNVSTRTKASPYRGIGIMDFYENFDEIIEFYRVKKKKESVYQNIMRFRSSVFTHNVPVYSSLLRPLVKEDSKMCLFEVNKSYGIILANANTVRDKLSASIDTKIISESALFEIQDEFNKIFKLLIDNDLSSKNGILRGNICSVRADYSARAVIVPATGHDIDEVSLPYVAGCELLRPLIIHKLSMFDNMSVRKANDIVDRAIRKFSKRIWLLMNIILSESKCPPRCYIQRSPSLLQESIRLVRIKEIKSDYYDLTMSIPTGLLDGLAGDFDGDTLSIIMIFDKNLIKSWEYIHSPVNHFISRHTGKYNNLCGYIKDQCVILSEMWQMGKNFTYYDEWASEKEKNEILNQEC